MCTNPKLRTAPLRAGRRSKEGVALIIVLVMLVLLSGLMVGFMTTATNERSATQVVSGGMAARQFADTTTNLVIGQIREATNTPEDRTWASQPGAIRTYGGNLSNGSKKPLPAGAYYYPYTENGATDYVYKLYSADMMKVPAATYRQKDLPDEVGVINLWDRKNPAEDYVDLNEPVLIPRLDLDPSGKTVEPHYPIIDPRAKYDRNGQPNKTATSGIVDGFDAKSITDDSLKAVISGSSTAPLPYLPLPVKWLYVLRDGSVGSPTKATKDNPIVGRVAFWTDDECAKLNINTASEGTFWDTPSVSTEPESGRIPDQSGNIVQAAEYTLSLGASQPARNEYQRYPGHPATTSLSPVLGWLWNITPATKPYPFASGYATFKEAIYNMSPFTPVWGSSTRMTSRGATFNEDPYLPLTGNEPQHTTPVKHLYASVDELLFKPQRLDAAGKATLNDKLTPSALEKMKFFLTTSSRAPELNLFGRPRVTIWPVNGKPENRTHFDDIFTFTSTIAKAANPDNDKGFFLLRQDPTSNTADYLGVGIDPVKFPNLVKQNQKMFDYLRYLTGSNGPNGPSGIPGFGGTFEKKYPQDRDQILTEIFDYVRTVNLVDTGTASRATNKFAPYTPYYFKSGIQSYSRVARPYEWSGQVVPLTVNINGQINMGMGRFLTIAKAALVFTREAGNATMRGMLVLEMATTMPGYPALRETYYTTARATRPTYVTINPTAGSTHTDIQFPTSLQYNICNVPNNEVGQGRGFMPTLGFVPSMFYYPDHKGPTSPLAFYDANGALNPDLDPNRNPSYTVTPKTFTNGGNGTYLRGTTLKTYPYCSQTFPVPANSGFAMRLEPGAFEVQIYSGEAPDDPRRLLIQTATLDFGREYPTVNINATGVGTDVSSKVWISRLGTGLDDATDMIGTGDIVRGLEYTGDFKDAKAGDLRLAAMTPVLVDKDFSASGQAAYNSSAPQVHSLQRGHGDPESPGYYGGGQLGMNAVIRTGKPPLIPKFINGVLRGDAGPGDFDRGLSKHMDGAFGNKVDEGNVRFSYGESNESYKIPYFHGRNIEDVGQSFFSPNRQMPSVAMIGSLPTGVKSKQPWQTILLRPDREGSKGHPGAKTTPDHLWLDLFHMPVVEPYAISEPFSTAGKVNMNYVIAPFGYAKGDSGNNPNTTNRRSYVRRDTGLRGVLKSTFVMAVPTTMSEGGHAENCIGINTQTRYPIDLDKTLSELEYRLNDQGSDIAQRNTTLFRSASEICDIDLYPLGLGVTDWNSFWVNYAQTGDNMRERPYAHIYPRLTTKSNVFTVHMRCQSIKKSSTTDPQKFVPGKDQIAGEYRGSSTIERFIDPNDSDPSDNTSLLNYDAMREKVEPYYRYRVVGTKQFSPH